jgi:hypothetical protein
MIEGSLFLPFTPSAKATERTAIAIKSDHAFGPYEAVDPFELAARMGVAVVDGSWLRSLPPELGGPALQEFGGSWSAGSISCDGTRCVLVNPTHNNSRQLLSLAEELVHESLGHPKSQIISRDGVTFRTCDHSIEDEAYSVAAALAVPYRPLFKHVNAGLPLESFSSGVPVSLEAVEFRVKRTGLWRTYRARRRSANAL